MSVCQNISHRHHHHTDDDVDMKDELNFQQRFGKFQQNLLIEDVLMMMVTLTADGSISHVNESLVVLSMKIF